MKCQQCGFDNNSDDRFCIECGSELSLKCPNCQAEIRSGAKFCGKCGQNLYAVKTNRIDFSEPQSYTPKPLADKILTDRKSLEGERKIVTVFFADVAGFTAMSEKLDPEEVHSIMDGCFQILLDSIHQYEGTVNQFTGDGCMAIFGAPVALEDHAQRACHAALVTQKELISYAEKIKAKYEFDFKIRIGLNSGPVVVTAVRDDLKMDYTAIGDTVNLASRMEANADPGTVQLSENTSQIVSQYFELEDLGKIEVKGKEKPQSTYRLTKSSQITTRIEASVAKGLTRFVGRKDNLSTLNELYAKASQGNGQVVGISGDAGVGKSRLLMEFFRQFPDGTFKYLRGQCAHFGGDMPYMPILDVVRSYYDLKEGESVETIRNIIQQKTKDLDTNLKTIVSPILDLLSVKPNDESYQGLEPKEKKEKILEAIRDLLVGISQNQPLVLVIEDLHWIDDSSEKFLTYLMEWLTHSRILLLLIFRPEYDQHWKTKSYITHIALDQLNPTDSLELIKAILEEGEVASELKDLILTRAAGNPLYMEEFTLSLLEDGAIQKQEDRYVVRGDLRKTKIPDTIQGIIAARIDRLEENLKKTIQVASVIGRYFAYRVLSVITDTRDELKLYLLNLQGLEFIHAKKLYPELEYIFKHALIQEVAYESLLSARKKEIHQKIGEAIENLYPNRLEQFYEMLIYHFSKAENLTKAYQYFKLAGESAYLRNLISDAFNLLRNALDLSDRIYKSHENIEEKVDILDKVTTLLVELAYPDESEVLLRRGERLAEEINNKSILASFQLKLANYYRITANHVSSHEYYDKGVENARQSGELEVIVRAMITLSLIYSTEGDFKKCWRTASDAIEIIEKSGRKNEYFGMFSSPYIYLKCMKAGSYMYIGKNIAEMKTTLDEIDSFVCESGNGIDKIYYGFYRSFWSVEMRELNEAKQQVENTIKQAEKHGQESFIDLFTVWLGTIYAKQGERDQGIKYITEGVKKLKKGSFSGSITIATAAFHLVDLDYFENIDEMIDEAYELCRKENTLYYEGLLKIGHGMLIGKRNPEDMRIAEKIIRDGMNMINQMETLFQVPTGNLVLGELYLKYGKKEKALENLRKAESAWAEMGVGYWLDRTRKALEKLK